MLFSNERISVTEEANGIYIVDTRTNIGFWVTNRANELVIRVKPNERIFLDVVGINRPEVVGIITNK